MVRKAIRNFDVEKLSKGQLAKLNALRKSLGEKIADKAFGEWLATQDTGPGETPDKNAHLIEEALQPLIKEKRLRIQRGGYLLRRGRGRVIVEPAEKASPSKATQGS